MPEQGKINPLDAFAAIEDMKKTVGWKLFIEKYSAKGDVYVGQLFDITLTEGVKYTKRDLVAHQLEALKTVQDVLNDFETDAKVELDRRKHPPQRGA